MTTPDQRMERVSDERLETTQQCAQCQGQKATRISDEQLSSRCAETQHAIDACTSWQYETKRLYQERLAAFRELQALRAQQKQHEAFVAQLRELFQRMDEYMPATSAGRSATDYQLGQEQATMNWCLDLDSLLGSAQADNQ